MSIFVIIIYRSLLECFVVVRLQGNLLHRHYITRLVVYGSVDLSKVTLAYGDGGENKIQNMKKYRPILTPRCQEKRTSLALMWIRSSGWV